MRNFILAAALLTVAAAPAFAVEANTAATVGAAAQVSPSAPVKATTTTTTHTTVKHSMTKAPAKKAAADSMKK